MFKFYCERPALSIDFIEGTLKLGVKLTPPFPGVSASGGESEALAAYNLAGLASSANEIRWDNLFLHLGHVYVEMDGRLDRTGVSGEGSSVFGATGNIVALKDTKIAQCRGTLALTNWQLQKMTLAVYGDIRPKGLSIGGIRGDLAYLPKQDIRLSGALDLAGYQLRGALAYVTKKITAKHLTSTAVFDVDMSGRLPVVGNAAIAGRTNTAFTDFQLTANGAVSVPFTIKEIHYYLDSTPGNNYFDWWWSTPDGKQIHYVTEAPRIDLIDEAALRAELFGMVALSMEPGAILPFHEDVLDPAPPPIPGPPDDPDQSKRSSGEVETVNESGMPSPIVTFVEGSELVTGASGPPYFQFGRIDIKDTPFEKWDNVQIYQGWIHSDVIWLQLTELSAGDAAGHVLQIAVHKDGSIDNPAFPSGSNWQAYAAKTKILNGASWRAGSPLNYHAMANAAKQEATHKHPFAISEWDGDGFLVSSSVVDSPTITVTSLPNGQRNVVRFWIAPHDGRDLAVKAFGRGIPEIDATAGKSLTSVIAFRNHAERPLCAVLTALSSDHQVLTVQRETGSMEFELNIVGGLDFADSRKAAAAIASACWAEEAALNGVFYIGPVGSCLAESGTQSGWKLLPKFAQTPRFTSVSRLQMERLARTNIEDLSLYDLIPHQIDWQTVPSETIAQQAVTDWESLKRRQLESQRWNAQPMGVLVEVGKSDQ